MPTDTVAVTAPPLTLAYVADGKLYTQVDGRPAASVDSVFVQQILDRVERNRQRNDWKSAGMAWNIGAANRGLPTPGDLPVGETRRIRFTGVTNGGNDLYYALDTDHAGGLFHYEPATGYERRLLHRNGFRATDLARHPTDGVLAFAVHLNDGTAHLATFNPEGRGVNQLTEGDAVDEAPSWAPGQRALVFQSAGIARSANGAFVGLSPYAVHKLDLDRNEMTILAESDTADLLLPRLADDGSLFYVRRPYRPAGPQHAPWRILVDLLLFPFRLVRAIAHFLNFFSLMFSRKPLISAGGPPKDGPDARRLLLWGRMVDANRALRAGGDGHVAPADYELVRRDPAGAETVLAKHVLAFDRRPDGDLLYTDGTRIWHLPATPGAPARQVAKGTLIDRVTFATA